MTASFAFQFLIHCEGTRFTEKKHQISMQVAQAKGLPSLKHHLLPRTKGFAITVKCLRDVGKDDGQTGVFKARWHVGQGAGARLGGALMCLHLSEYRPLLVSGVTAWSMQK